MQINMIALRAEVDKHLKDQGLNPDGVNINFINIPSKKKDSRIYTSSHRFGPMTIDIDPNKYVDGW